MEEGRKKPIALIVTACLVIAASFIAGTYYGYHERPAIEGVIGVSNKTPSPSDVDLKDVDFDPFWKAWSILEEKHVGETPIDRQKMVWGAIQGLASSLGDPYTVFFPPKDKEDFSSEIKGEFSGIGAEIGIRKEILTVIAPLKDSPSEKAGMKAGDKILKIGDEFTNDMTLDDAIHKIRGERGTEVTLTILHNGEDKPLVIKVRRDVIKVPVLVTEKKEGGIFVMHLYSFSENSHIEFRRAVQEFLKSGSKKLVVDLRNNPGGYFSSAVDIASWFLPEGDIVAQQVSKTGDPEVYRSSGYGVLENIPTVLLVNQGSASASEILAGALSEHKKATLIGEKTFGKGSVQELEDLTENTSLKITIAKWLTPSGKSISKEGLAPDIEVKIPEDNEPGKDLQMEKALEYLRSK